MKKIYIIITLLLLPTIVLAKSTYSTDIDYEVAKNMIQETMKAYYLKGSQIQYNYSKAQYGVTSPEEATSQDMKYFVCAAFTYTTYTEAFGTKYISSTSEFPRYNYEISDTAREYYKDNKNNSSALDGNYLIYYENTTEDNQAKYIYNNATSFEEFVNIIKPGDLFVYSGHALIAYDVVTNPQTGKKDVIILNSTADEYIRTRIDGTSKLSHNFFKSPSGDNGFLDVSEEGTIQWFWLSNSSKFVSSNKISCSEDECGVLRVFYEDETGKTTFNYKPTQNSINKTKTRIQYPNLTIEKTINKGDNNSVYLEDELIYTIKITNNSNVSPNGVNYSKFYIEETLSDYVSYVSSNGTINNKKIVWEINSLEKNKSITLTYKVKVNKDFTNINKVIKSEGKFYGNNSDSYITTGTIENKIIPKVTNKVKSYETCFNEVGDIAGLEMLDKVYACVYNDIDFEFDNFNFENIFTKYSGESEPSKGKAQLIYPKDVNNQYYKMILNNYWNGLYRVTNSKFFLPRWSGEYTNSRARTINERDFKDGDILIYKVSYDTTSSSLKRTYESGIYAFIYINGKFVRKNVSSQSDRVEFTHEYYNNNIDKFPNMTNTICSKYGYSVGAECNYFYNLYGGTSKLTSTNKEEILDFVNYQTLFDKDYYVILRPELLIKQKDSIEVDTTTLPTTTYNKNDQTINISGAKLNIIYNDGTKKQIKLDNQSVKITGFDTSEVGQNNVVIEYNGLTTTLVLDVVDKTPEEPPVNNEEPTETPENDQEYEDNPNTGAFVNYIFLIIFAILSLYLYSYIKKKDKIIKL